MFDAGNIQVQDLSQLSPVDLNMKDEVFTAMKIQDIPSSGL